MRLRIVRLLAAAAVAAATVVAVTSTSVAGQGSASAQGAASLPGTDNIKAFIASRVAKGFVPPKTPWGHPDISGVFTSKDEANTPLERPDEWAGRNMNDITPKEFAEAISQRQQEAVERAPFAGGGEPEEGVAIAVPIHWFDNLAAQNSRPWFVIDPIEGKVPPTTPGAASLARSRSAATGPRGPNRDRGGLRETFLQRSLGDRCIIFSTGGIWQMPIIYGNSYQILQTPDYVIMRYEMVHEARMIPLDGRPHVNNGIRGYFGDSRGHWDGNTLVVETTNLNDNLVYRGYSVKDLRLVERFTRISPTRVEWTMTVDNPGVWERPWTYSFPLTEDNQQIIYEYACHEGNFGMANLLTAGRLAEKEAEATPR